MRWADLPTLKWHEEQCRCHNLGKIVIVVIGLVRKIESNGQYHRAEELEEQEKVLVLLLELLHYLF